MADDRGTEDDDLTEVRRRALGAVMEMLKNGQLEPLTPEDLEQMGDEMKDWLVKRHR